MEKSRKYKTLYKTKICVRLKYMKLPISNRTIAVGSIAAGLVAGSFIPVNAEQNVAQYITDEYIIALIDRRIKETSPQLTSSASSSSSSSMVNESSSASSEVSSVASSVSSESVAPVVEQVQQVAQDVEQIKTQNQSLESRVTAVEQAISSSASSSSSYSIPPNTEIVPEGGVPNLFHGQSILDHNHQLYWSVERVADLAHQLEAKGYQLSFLPSQGQWQLGKVRCDISIGCYTIENSKMNFIQGDVETIIANSR